MKLKAIAKANMDALAANSYPGRGIVIGRTPDGRHLAQVYWIMGRSENSRNRVFVREGDLVRTQAHDPAKLSDPTLIIYNCMCTSGRAHVVSNGDQTDTICHALQVGRTFEAALFTRTFEPDAHFTPRIAGIVDLDDELHAYKLAILKDVADGRHCSRQVFSYQTAIAGIGHCITTYSGDGDPLPAFEGEPYAVEMADGADALARLYWETLNEDNKVALAAKLIEVGTGRTHVTVTNKNG